MSGSREELLQQFLEGRDGTDRNHLMWIHARLTEVHGDNPLCDYMHKLRAIIKSTPKNQNTHNVSTSNDLESLIREIKSDDLDQAPEWVKSEFDRMRKKIELLEGRPWDP